MKNTKFDNDITKYLNNKPCGSKFKIWCCEEIEFSSDNWKYDEISDEIYVECPKCHKCYGECWFPKQALEFYKWHYNYNWENKKKNLSEYLCLAKENLDLNNEIKDLKSAQKKLAIEKLGELENWINQPYTKSDCYYLNKGATIETADLQQKIKELKGERK